MHQFDKDIFLEQFHEIYEGVPVGSPSWVVSNVADSGVFGSIEDLDAYQASARPCGGLAIAAHVYHLSWSLGYALSFHKGEAADWDWSTSWEVKQVDEQGWRDLLSTIRHRYLELCDAISRHEEWSEREMVAGTLALVSHGAYHLGVIRLLRGRVLAGASGR